MNPHQTASSTPVNQPLHSTETVTSQQSLTRLDNLSTIAEVGTLTKTNLSMVFEPIHSLTYEELHLPSPPPNKMKVRYDPHMDKYQLVHNNVLIPFNSVVFHPGSGWYITWDSVKQQYGRISENELKGKDLVYIATETAIPTVYNSGLQYTRQ